MRKIAYEFSPEAGVIIRVRFEKESGHIHAFVIQLACLFDDKWQPVVRYDTVHGFAHQDVMHPSGQTEKKELPVASFNEGFTFAERDIKENWSFYRERYRRWLR